MALSSRSFPNRMRLAAFPLGRVFFLLVFLTLQFSASADTASTSPRELLAQGRVDEAIEVLDRQIAHSPDAESYNLLCRAHFMLEEWDRGIPNCERARDLDPKNSFYELWLGRIYGEKADRAGLMAAAGLAKKVRVAFERAVELDPSNWQARTDLAEFYIDAPGIVGGGKDKARQQADALMTLNPARSHWVAGRIAEKNKDAAAAQLLPPCQSPRRHGAGPAPSRIRADRSRRFSYGRSQPSVSYQPRSRACGWSSAQVSGCSGRRRSGVQSARSARPVARKTRGPRRRGSGISRRSIPRSRVRPRPGRSKAAFALTRCFSVFPASCAENDAPAARAHLEFSLASNRL